MIGDTISFQNATLRLNDLLENLKIIEAEREIVTFRPLFLPKEQHATFTSIVIGYNHLGLRKRQFDYEAMIISIYGTLQNFVVKTVEEYLRELSAIVPKFSQLPTAIKDKHLSVCTRLAGRIIQSPDLVDVDLNKIYRNAYEAETNDRSDSLVAEAFSAHTANVRSAVVEQLFTSVDVKNILRRTADSAPFRNLVQPMPEASAFDLSKENTFFYLDDLCSHRNQVAHGRSQNILSLSSLLPYLKFALAFCAGVNFVVQQDLAQIRAKHNGVLIGTDARFFRKIGIVGFENILEKVAVSSKILFRPQSKGSASMNCIITDIKIEDKAAAAASVGDRNVTLKLEPFPVGKGAFYLMP